jgi:hypothetical protein
VRHTTRVLTSCLVACLALLATSAPAAAAPRRITGKLSQAGYTVIALAANGKAAAVRTASGRFTLRPPARRVTLHLRAPGGVYAGPIVVGRQQGGRRAILGVAAGARLGRVEVREGYARVSKRLSRRSIDASRWARARKGVPIGAGVFGRVRSRLARGAVRGDLDVDGIPQPLDIDDDGDLVLDNLDSSPAGRRARAAQTGGCGPANIYCPGVSSGLNLFLQESVNANAGPPVDENLIDDALRLRGVLRFDGIRGAGGPIELDCAGDPLASPPRLGLGYCSPGGSGTAGGPAGGPPFPGPPGGTVDPDGDGFGVLDPALEPLACGGGCPGSFFLLHGAVARRPDLPPTISQIGSGDQFLEHVATDGDTSRCPPPPPTTNDACVSSTFALQYVFATVPALVRYSDTVGHSTTLSYPVVPPGCPASPLAGAGGCPGTESNGFVVAPGPDGNIRLRLTFWRPQRRPIGSGPQREACLDDAPPCEWVDVGHLTYGVQVQGSTGYCSQDDFAQDDPNTPDVTERDDNLSPATPHLFLHGGGGFDDGKNDVASSPGDTSPGRTFSYTLNLTKCLADLGIPFGDELMLTFVGAPGAPSTVSQVVSFRRPSGITVKNQTDPPESPTSGTEFDFHPIVNSGSADFKLRHDGTQSFDVPAGGYRVQELAAPGYDLTAVTCDDSDSTGSTAEHQADFHVAGGEHVTCTFTNKKQ